MSEKKIPRHIARMRALEGMLDRRSKEAELRLKNDISYARSNIPHLLGEEVVQNVEKKSPMVGRLLGRILPGGRKPTRKQQDTDDFRQLVRRPSYSPSSVYTTSRPGLRGVLEDLLLPVLYGLLKGRVLAVGIKGSGKLFGALFRRIRRAL